MSDGPNGKGCFVTIIPDAQIANCLVGSGEYCDWVRWVTFLQSSIREPPSEFRNEHFADMPVRSVYAHGKL